MSEKQDRLIEVEASIRNLEIEVRESRLERAMLFGEIVALKQLDTRFLQIRNRFLLQYNLG